MAQTLFYIYIYIYKRGFWPLGVAEPPPWPTGVVWPPPRAKTHFFFFQFFSLKDIGVAEPPQAGQGGG
jgi:hypothetical protein